MKDQDHTTLDWKMYEDITKYIYEMLGSKYGIKIVGHGNKFRILGKSGVKHQIDVLTEQVVDDKVYRTAIECKYVTKKVTKEIVMKLRAEMDDADIASGIIVCKSGYTKDTLIYAKHQGIKLVTLKELEEGGDQTVSLATLEFVMNFTLTRPTIVSIDFGTFIISDPDEIYRCYINGYATLLTPTGSNIPMKDYIFKFIDVMHEENQPWKTRILNCGELKAKLVRAHHEDQDINKIIFTGILVKTNNHSRRFFDLVDQVWMIMEEIFEENAYNLTKNGILFKSHYD